MRFDRFTIKSQELIQNAQTLASTHGNQQIEPEHLLAAMLEEKDGVARSVFKRLGAADEHIANQVTRAIDRLEKLEFVRRKTDEQDKRSILVQRSVKGSVFLREFADMAAEAAREMNRTSD